MLLFLYSSTVININFHTYIRYYYLYFYEYIRWWWLRRWVCWILFYLEWTIRIYMYVYRLDFIFRVKSNRVSFCYRIIAGFGFQHVSYRIYFRFNIWWDCGNAYLVYISLFIYYPFSEYVIESFAYLLDDCLQFKELIAVISYFLFNIIIYNLR